MTRDRWKSTASRIVLAATFAAAFVLAPVAVDLSGDGPLTVSSAAAQSAGDGDNGDTSGSDRGGIGVDAGVGVGGLDASVGAEVGSGGVSAGAGAEVGGGGVDAGADVGAGGSAGGDSGGGGNAGGGSDSGGDNGGNNGDDSGSGSSSGGGAGEGAEDGAAGGPGSQGTENATGPSADEADGAETGRGDHPGIRSTPTPLSYFAALNVETPAFQRYSNAAERNDLQAAGLALAAATNRPVTSDLVAYVNDELDVRTALAIGQIAAAANGVPVHNVSDTVSSAAGRLAEDAPQ